ncbi:MAG TPA: hypothetical protein VEH86_00205 [Candidatus Acidoferrum sp.]|nr:hypothetical protein [Candidatus Acidoferrum sp.]
MKVSGLWEILTRFKDMCGRRGWKTTETEDWVEVKNKYHNFVWVRNIHPTSFKKIATNNKCTVQEGLTYRVVQSSYTAWLFSEIPSEALAKTVLENPVLSCKIALYDLSSFQEGKNICGKLNQTDSPVFKEFEEFLQNELKVKLHSFPSPGASVTLRDDCTVTRLA